MSSKDICLNELQDRGELATHEGRIVVPYVCDHMVQTILTGRRWSDIGIDPVADELVRITDQPGG